MHVDLKAVFVEALTDPRVGAALAEHFRPVVRAELAAREADAWLSTREAARYLYGCDGKEDAFRKLRTRHPELDRLSQGRGRLRRWKRADLDAFQTLDTRRSRRQGTNS